MFFGGHFNLRKFLLGLYILQKQLDPNFLLLCISFLLCMDLQPSIHDHFFKNIKNFLCKQKLVNNRSIPSMHAERKHTVCSHKHSFTPFPPLLTLTDGQNDGRRNKYTRCAWAGGTFFPVVLLCHFSVLAGNRFWFYILTYVT